MDYEACRDNLPLWMAGALSPAEDQAVRRHLVQCGDCRAARDALAEVADAWVESEVAPDWTDHAVMREACRRQLPAPALAATPRESRRAPRLWPVLWAATLLVALGGGRHGCAGPNHEPDDSPGIIGAPRGADSRGLPSQPG